MNSKRLKKLMNEDPRKYIALLYRKDIKVIGYEWRSGIEIVGIILVKSDAGNYRAYIGVAEGISESFDSQYIASSGARIPYREALAFFPELQDKQNLYQESEDLI